MSSTPRFLMNGINMKQNFIGYQLYKTTIYGVIEIGAIMSPMYFLLKNYSV
jgi:hypothetical protein